MSAKLFVGNLSPKTTGEQLTRFFSSAGIVASVRMPLDRETGRPRGFAFVEFPSKEQAEQAVKVFDGRELGGNRLRVSMARPETGDRRERSGRPGSPRETQGRRSAGDVPGLEASEDWSPLKDHDPYDEEEGRRRRRRGKHGSDRKRRYGTRRYLD